VIGAAFRSEWIKLRRRNLVLGTFGGLTLAASFFTVLVFGQASAVSDPSLASLGQPNGLIHGLGQAVILLGIVAFGIAASQIANEYSLGTLRQLLVRQPRRTALLTGKYLGVIVFVVAAVVFAAVVTGGVAVVMAHARHVPTAAWFTRTGMGDLGRALGELLLAVIGFATLGLAVGLFLRSSVFAVIVGFAFLLPVEAIVSRVLPSANHWLPGLVLEAVGQGGTPTLSFSRALLISTLYVVAVAALTGHSFARRDVTA
jgi:ABC-2 type transport system permease protein